jgi:hypothetical protein
VARAAPVGRAAGVRVVRAAVEAVAVVVLPVVVVAAAVVVAAPAAGGSAALDSIGRTDAHR